MLADQVAVDLQLKQYFSFYESFLAGLPAYFPGSNISFVTTLPAPIIVPLTILTGMIVAFEPIITSFSIMIFPNWLGIFFSNKHTHYIVGGIVWGCLWTVGLVAYEGMSCR